jgi:hypothetical protein
VLAFVRLNAGSRRPAVVAPPSTSEYRSTELAYGTHTTGESTITAVPAVAFPAIVAFTTFKMRGATLDTVTSADALPMRPAAFVTALQQRKSVSGVRIILIHTPSTAEEARPRLTHTEMFTVQTPAGYERAGLTSSEPPGTLSATISVPVVGPSANQGAAPGGCRDKAAKEEEQSEVECESEE